MWRSGVYTMDFFIWASILSIALALPSQDGPVAKPSCIRMTPEKERQIDIIVEKIGHFLSKITAEHEHFDIRLIKLAIEQHSEDEVEEKETVLQLSVNDCELTDDEIEEIDHHRKKAKEHELEKAKAKQAKDKTKKEDKKSEDFCKQEANQDTNTNEKDAPKSGKNFEVMYLDLGDKTEQIAEVLGKHPRLVYVQKDRGQLDYMFLKRR